MGRKGKTSKGRKKSKMITTKDENESQICFSKLKKCVFAKACELSTTCGTEVALLIHSPNGTPHSFGSPSVDKIFNQFMTGEQSLDPVDPDVMNVIKQLNQEYMEISEQLDVAETKREVLEERIKQATSEAKECDWLDKIDQLNRDELLQLLGSLYRAKCSINDRMSALDQDGAEPCNMNASTSMPSDTIMASGRMNQEVAPALETSNVSSKT